MPDYPVFIPDAGASLATTNVLEGKAPVRWLERKTSKDPVDNGWRVMSAIDTGEYLSDGDNWRIADYNELCEIEPALIAVWNMPVGSQLRIELHEDGSREVLNDVTGTPIPLDSLLGNTE